MSEENLKLWSDVEKTDPSHTKQFTRGGGFSGTAINATYVMKRLTEQFGPCGVGWRMVIEDDRMEEGHTLKDGSICKIHVVRGHLEYVLDGEWRSTGPQFGQTTFVGQYQSSGTYTDEEAPKKSITDCMTKCAVMLGVCADIHLGLFDDNKYVNNRREEVEKKSASMAKQDKDLERISAALKACTTERQLAECWKKNGPQMKILPKDFVDALIEVKDDKKKELAGEAPSEAQIAASQTKDEIIAQLSECFNTEAIQEVEAMYAQELGDMKEQFPDLHTVVMEQFDKRHSEVMPGAAA